MLRLPVPRVSEQSESDFEWLILDGSPEPSAYFSTLALSAKPMIVTG